MFTFDVAKIRWFLASFQLFSHFFVEMLATESRICDKLRKMPRNLSQSDAVTNEISSFY